MLRQLRHLHNKRFQKASYKVLVITYSVLQLTFAMFFSGLGDLILGDLLSAAESVV